MRKIYYFTKEQLEDLYVNQGLSLNKIAKRFGCHGVTILDNFKKFNIKRRPNNFNKIKISKEILEYLYWSKKLSLIQIAKQLGYTEITVLRRIREFGIKTRPVDYRKIDVPKEVLEDLYWKQNKKPREIAKMFGIKNERTIREKMEKFDIKRKTQSEAQTVKMKKPFTGDLAEKAYLLGLRAGDFYAKRNHLCIRIQTSTTHLAQIDLLRNALGHYSDICIYLQNGKFGKEWYIYADLHPTFEFFLEKPKEIPKWISENNNYFYNFLMAYADCEGCFRIAKSHNKGIRLFFQIDTGDLEVLKNIKNKLELENYHPFLYLKKKKGIPSKAHPEYISKLDIYRLVFNRKKEIISLIAILLPLSKHSEKIRKMNMILSSKYSNQEQCLPFWNNLIKEIKTEILKEQRCQNQ